MAYGRHVRVYLWKNLLEKRYAVFGSICEICCPLTLVALMAALYAVISRSYYDVATYEDRVFTVDDLPFTALQYQMGAAGQWIGLAPNNSDTQALLASMDALYPAVNLLDLFNVTQLAALGFAVNSVNWAIPSFSDVVKVFETEADMEAHVQARGYGTGDSVPLYMGLVLHRAAPAWQYSIRMNYTLVPSTSGSQLDSFARSANFGAFFGYLQASGNTDDLPPSMQQFDDRIPGFAQVQLAVDRALINMPGQPPSVTRTSNFIQSVLEATVINSTNAVEFIRAQSALNDLSPAIPLLTRPLTMTPQSVSTLPFPTPAYSTNGFYGAAKDVFALFFVLSLLVPVSRLIRGIVHEKETRVREGMKMMGMTDGALNTAWFITYWLVFLAIAIGATLITLGMFGNSNPGLVFLLFFLFGTSTTTCCFMIAALFSRSKTAAVLGMMIFFGLYFPSYALNATSSLGGVIAASLCCPVAFGLGMDNLAQFENDGVGITMHTLDTPYNQNTFSLTLVMLAVDTVLYFVLGWYLAQVVPSEFGVQRKPWFLCTPRYWCGNSKPGAANSSSMQVELLGSADDDGNGDAIVEPVGDDLKSKAAANLCLKVRGLYKQFDTPDGVKVAVNKLGMTMYEGEIFCLLGHNGAGKSTTISMLTGLIPPTAGHASIFGKDISTDMDELRQSMGVCPQHNVLFDNLTVFQHLQYFAAIKGMEASKVDAACRDMIREVGLVEKTNAPSKQLSGGQKRKLSVAIALIGDSKVVFLDEPTSGMDPYSRRSTWQVLQNNRTNRIIVLTTHFMDEADLLGDRIGIMHEGALRCCGSPMFLKSRYGVGYSLTAVKEAGCNSVVVQDVIHRHVPDATTLSNVGAEISFQLPLQQSSAFPAMLRELDSNMGSLKLETYGISVTTMEEVFLKVAQVGDEDFRERQRSKRVGSVTRAPSFRSGGGVLGSGSGAAESKLGELAEGKAGDASVPLGLGRPRSAQQSVRTRAQQGLFWRHFRALFQKRVRYFLRDKKAIAFQLVIPSLAILVGMILLKVAASTSQPPLQMNTSPYNPELANINPVSYVKQSSGVAFDVLSAIPPGNATLHGLTYSEVYSYFGTENPNARSDGPYTNTSKTLECMSEYLLATRATHAFTRYASFLITGQIGPSYPVPYVDATFLQNTTSLTAGPVFLNLLDKALLRLANPGVSSADITVYSYPLPMTVLETQAGQRLGALGASIIIVLCMAFIPAAFIVFIVREREVSAKHQQLISGVSIPAYWLSSLTYDSITYLLPGSIALIIVKAFGIEQFVDHGTFTATFLLFLLYGPASAAFSYMLSFFFKSHSMAQNIVMLINVTAVTLMLATFIMEFIPSTKTASAICKKIFMLMPGYALGEGLLNLAIRVDLKVLFNESTEPLGYSVAGLPLLYLGLSLPVYFLIAFGIDILLSFPAIRAKVFRDPAVVDPAVEEDQDVAAEAARVDTPGTEKDDAIRLTHMRKVYRNKKVAVRDLSFGVRHGECFGFLGINGAGKTTTLKMLSGDEIRTSGSARLMGFDIVNQQVQVRRLLGYCPQFDALLDLLTVREHLELFAKIKGVSVDRVEAVVVAKLREMDLTKFEHKTAGSLSGGNKRKLSVAIAMMGNPPLMFLDEPSTGMDPVARRFMWKVIAEMAKTSSIVLVSHSMEECEALCNRVGIMVGGRLRCLGTIQHLKDRFGQGYLSEIKLGTVSDEEVDELVARTDLPGSAKVTLATLPGLCAVLGDDRRLDLVTAMGPGWRIHAGLNSAGFVSVHELARWWAAENCAAHVVAFMEGKFAGATLSERHGDRLRFKLPKVPGMRLGDMFASIEAAKQPYNIDEYSLSQTSLEQIFNEFAAQQEEETEAVRGFGGATSTAGIVAAAPAEPPFNLRSTAGGGAGAVAKARGTVVSTASSRGSMAVDRR